MGYKPDSSNSGGPNSPNSYKELAMHLMNCRPELKGKLLTEGTWDFAIVDELKPEPGDLVVLKTRYSRFAGTTLDSQLRTRGIRYLFFAGNATNVCVESTLRDAYFHDCWPILIADSAMPAGTDGDARSDALQRGKLFWLDRASAKTSASARLHEFLRPLC
jgi:ureidoacrylate peracid hydrolase